MNRQVMDELHARYFLRVAIDITGLDIDNVWVYSQIYYDRVECFSGEAIVCDIFHYE